MEFAAGCVWRSTSDLRYIKSVDVVSDGKLQYLTIIHSPIVFLKHSLALYKGDAFRGSNETKPRTYSAGGP
jgi:hypothetical protein